jgi:malonate decarboxylase gamma subunit
MKLADILTSLFPAGHAVTVEGGRIHGQGPLKDGSAIQVLGVADNTPLGVDDAIWLAGQVLADPADRRPILLLIDSSSQRMARRDELLGISEYLAHLAKALLLAEAEGRRTVGLLYGHSAAGAFIATALAAGTLVALPGAHPEVMDLPSISRVTKLPLDTLQEMAKTTAVFAPGLDNLAQTGAVLATWDPAQSLGAQLAALLAEPASGDVRDALGKARGGRPMAADLAQRVHKLAQADG